MNSKPNNEANLEHLLSDKQLLGAQVNREYKDRVFKLLFKDKKNLLSLFNALNNTNYSNPEDIEINILENAIYMAMKNDISFLLDTRLPFYEQQSSFNPNMPLRGLIYIAGVLYKQVGNAALHRKSLVKIPVPQYVVFYNGLQEAPERQMLKLSDAFMDSEIKGSVECEALMLNINAGKNRELVEKCKPLCDYVTLVSKIREFQEAGMKIKAAVSSAVDWCITHDVLKQFLVSQREEIITMFLSEYDEEEIRRLWAEESREEGIKEGKKIGRQAGVKDGIEIAKKVYQLEAAGESIEEIAGELELSVEDVEAILDR